MELDNTLCTIGLALKAGRLAAGEDPAADECVAHNCRLLLTASDAAENTFRRAQRLAETGQCLLLCLPYPKEALGAAVGRAGCAVAAVTDLGFAQSIAAKLAEADPEKYGEAAQRLSVKARRAAERRQDQRERDKARSGRRRPGRKK